MSFCIYKRPSIQKTFKEPCSYEHVQDNASAYACQGICAHYETGVGMAQHKGSALQYPKAVKLGQLLKPG